MLTPPLQILLLVLVAVVAAATLPFAIRSLRGDRRGPLTVAGIAVMLLATGAAALAPDALWFAALWSVGTGATLVALGSSGGAPALRRGAPWLVGADLLLWTGTVLVLTGAAGPAAALCLVAAAVLRCALPPAHRWLVDSLHAATPVSAALHGGVVNGGGILVLAHATTIGAEPLATLAMAAVGGAAVVLGALAALVRTDVKGRLVMSTVSQLGFMLLMAASGLLAAAAVHLMAHGWYKSALFLGATGVVDARARRRARPSPPALSRSRWIGRTMFGAGSALVALGLAVPLYPATGSAAEPLLLAVLAAAAATAGAAAVRVPRSAAGAVAAAAAVAAATGAFAALTALLTRALQLPAIAEPAPVAVVGLSLLALVGIAAVRRAAPAGPLAHRLLGLGWALGSGAGARPRADAGRSPRSMGSMGWASDVTGPTAVPSPVMASAPASTTLRSSAPPSASDSNPVRSIA